jgi:hypothetical protein
LQYTSWYSIWPCGLGNVDLFKGLTHIGCWECNHTVFPDRLVLSCMFQWYLPLPHPTSFRAGVLQFNLSPVLTVWWFVRGHNGISYKLPG